MRHSTFAVIVICLIIGSVVLLALNREGGTDSFQQSYMKWERLNIDHYQMIVFALRPPQTPTALSLTIQGITIIDEAVVACEEPSDEYPERWCESSRKYYTYMARHTVEDLFEIAQQCINRTRLVLADCPSTPADFQSFEDFEELLQVQEMCKDYIGNYDVLCGVQFNQTYGYPEEIFTSMSAAADGVGTISVRDFQPIHP